MHSRLLGKRAEAALRQWRLARRARREAARLRSHGTPDSLLLADLVRRGTRWRLTADERYWVRRIESERKQLEQSSDTVHRAGDTPLAVAEVSRASQPWRGGRFLYAVVRAFRPARGIELGTCLGISAAYQAAALAAEGEGRLVTVEGYTDLADRAEQVWKALGIDNVEPVVGRFGQVLEPLVAADPVDYAYVDGNHHEAPTVEYFTAIQRHCTTRTLVVLDDIRWSEGMRRAWQRISTGPGVSASADLGRLGLVIVRPGT
jgi:predicted O-methyltransferase YrrM